MAINSIAVAILGSFIAICVLFASELENRLERHKLMRDQSNDEETVLYAKKLIKQDKCFLGLIIVAVVGSIILLCFISGG